MLFLCRRQIPTMKSCLQFLKNSLTAKLVFFFFFFACSYTSFYKRTESCNHDHNQHAEPSSLRQVPVSVKAPERGLGLFSTPTVPPFPRCPINETAQ